MRSVVRTRWLEYTEPLEGGVAYPYADIRNLITVAYGNLIDPLSAALSLPFMTTETPHDDCVAYESLGLACGCRATKGQITAGWLAVKGDPLAARRGHLYAKGLTNLRLTPQAMAALALGKLDANDTVLRGRIASWESHSACVQMALHSLAWATGPAFNFPKLVSAVNARDYDAASIHIQMREWTPEGRHNAGLVPRNTRNRILMRNAARVEAFGLDPDMLEWTRDLSVAEVPTQPELPVLNTVIMEHPASSPTIYVAPLPEEVTGSGGIVHADPRLYFLDEDPDDAA